MKKCVICHKTLKSEWYCKSCYKLWKSDILAKKPWIRFLFNEERKSRRKKEPPMVYLGDVWEISSDGRLVGRVIEDER